VIVGGSLCPLKLWVVLWWALLDNARAVVARMSTDMQMMSGRMFLKFMALPLLWG
jgi:hypothetical protein